MSKEVGLDHIMLFGQDKEKGSNHFKVTKEGLICPWCPNHPPIHQCPHDPFKLMKEVEELKADNFRLIGKVQNYDRLRNAIREMLR